MAEGTVFSGSNFLGTGFTIFGAVDFLANNILLPLGGLLMCLFIGWLWKPKNAITEIESTPGYVFKLKVVWSFILKFVAPILILIVLLSEFFDF